MNNVTNKTLMVLFLLAQTAFAGEDFSDGYHLGFNQGWKYVKGEYTVPPLSPIPPIPKIGYDSFFGGYDAGFVDGISKAEKR